jgi:hypothetical protein
MKINIFGPILSEDDRGNEFSYRQLLEDKVSLAMMQTLGLAKLR